MDPTQRPMTGKYDHDVKNPLVKGNSADSFMKEPANPYSGDTPLRPYTPTSHRAMSSDASREHLVTGAAPLGGTSGSPPPVNRQPTLPNFQNNQQSTAYGGYRGVAY